MRAASAELIAHIASPNRTMCRLWKVQRTDGETFGFTNHDRALTVDGLQYRADLGMSATSVQTSAGLSVDNLDATGFLASGTLTEADVAAGVWDHAEVWLREVNWADLTMGVLKEKRGRIGQITTTDVGYKAEFRGLAAKLNAAIGGVFAPGCPHALGDAGCQKDTTDFTAVGTVTSVEADNRTFDTDLASATVRLTPAATGNPDNGYFSDGLLTWLTGANAGLAMDVKLYTDDGRIELHLPMGFAIAPADTFSVVAGCDKDGSDTGHCKVRFDNVINHGGYRDLPGVDVALQAPGQSTTSES